MMSFSRSIQSVGILTVCVVLLCSAHAQENAARTQLPSGPYRISGMVVSSKGGGVLARARVTIADVKNRQSMQSVVTGDDGHFQFHVPAGKYSLEGARRGFITASYNQHEQFSTAIAAGADFDSENLALQLAPDAVLSGKVLDEFAEPVRQAQIVLYRENHLQGLSRVVRFRAAMTDDQGRYEVTELDAGTYFVSAKASPWYVVRPPSSGEGETALPSQVDPSLDVVYPITFYGDATEAEDAAAIPIRGGDRLEADIHMNPSPSLHLLVHVPESSQGVNLPTLQKPAFDGSEQVENTNIQNVAPGVYEISGVAAGRYTVRAPDSSGRMKEPTEVDLNGGGELDFPAGNATGTIKVAAQIQGGSILPSPFQISLLDGKHRIITLRVDDTGEATFSDLTPGKYILVANSMTQAYSVASMVSESGTIPGRELSVPAGASLSISLTLVGSPVTVEGFAKRAGKGASGAMIVLVPKDPEANLDRFRRDQSDSDGSFALRNVFPGSYTVVAIEDGWELDWAQTAALARYLEHGQTVEVSDRSPTTLHLADAVNVQTP